MGIPDTGEGRFENITLHVFLILHRLKQDHDATGELAQSLFDHMFKDMDDNLREMGVGDMRIPKRIFSMVESFYGRTKVYQSGLENEDDSLAGALRRNLYHQAEPGKGEVDGMVAYIRRESGALANQPLDRLLRGELQFGPPPSFREG